ncbi:uroporphyrinogen-III C-methyltransferase [Listeria sp. FSL L7-1485]|uniref:Uroporphyrinogen-III C-methyltransferase n=1 Tax=Listeria immobilis TaxID=2713502 RepID=A0A7X1CA63_9LIST|nr:uroporphyrinogen-III C-methyltransferase [Listeria immobilis]MBC1490068.1 uroporphyrinogen-III C-methyltransferase [Listeria immobilis]MBC1537169.1 uroporphyrinogen-III C-methyltransferase [Listeria immobilis]
MGKVILIGAGPGDAQLLTVKGLAALQKADVIVYDRLVEPAMLQERKASCKLIYVGKEPSHHPIPQEEIEQILVRESKVNELVVRLKAGDPYVFGRGGEEGETLYQAGIPFEVIPGITSAIGGLAYAGIPVTHRDFASSFHVITGHLKKGRDPLDWEALARLEGTLVFLMGMTNLPNICANLLAGGRKPETAVGIVQWASRGKQLTVTGDLVTIEQKVAESGISSPALIVVGDVVTLRPQLNFFEEMPLFHTKILLPRARAGKSMLAENIRDLGGEVTMYPNIQVLDIKPTTTAEQLARKSELLFTSKEAVERFFSYVTEINLDIRSLKNTHLTAIGKQTNEAFKEKGIIPDTFIKRRSNELVLEHLPRIQKNESSLIIGSVIDTAEVKAMLPEITSIQMMPLYDMRPVTERPFDLQCFNQICFASSRAVHNLLEVLTSEEKALLQQKTILSIGKFTSATLKTFGFHDFYEAESATPESLIKLIKKTKLEGVPQ